MFINLTKERIINSDHLISVEHTMESEDKRNNITFIMVGGIEYSFYVRDVIAIKKALAIAQKECNKARSAYFEFRDTLSEAKAQLNALEKHSKEWVKLNCAINAKEDPYEKEWTKWKAKVNTNEELLKGDILTPKQVKEILNTLTEINKAKMGVR